MFGFVGKMREIGLRGRDTQTTLIPPLLGRKNLLVTAGEEATPKNTIVPPDWWNLTWMA